MLSCMILALIYMLAGQAKWSSMCGHRAAQALACALGPCVFIWLIFRSCFRFSHDSRSCTVWPRVMSARVIWQVRREQCYNLTPLLKQGRNCSCCSCISRKCNKSVCSLVNSYIIYSFCWELPGLNTLELRFFPKPDRAKDEPEDL